MTTRTSPAPVLTPLTLTKANAANTAAMMIARADPAVEDVARARPADPAKALATDATANDAINQEQHARQEPDEGPERDLDSRRACAGQETRFPAAAKSSRSISAISAAQTT